MENKIQKITEIDGVQCYFDPLRKEESFLILQKDSEMKAGMVVNEEIIFESNANIKWNNVSKIIAGFSGIDRFTKIKEGINE